MDAELIKLIAGLPLEALLIYIIVRQQGQIEKLLASIIEGERAHARDLVEIVCSGRINGGPGPAIIREDNISESARK